MENKIEKTETFADRLQFVMKEKRLNQKQLAKLSHLSTQTVSYYCNNARLPNTDVLKQIVLALGVSADYLLGIESDKVKEFQNTLKAQTRSATLDEIIVCCERLKTNAILP